MDYDKALARVYEHLEEDRLEAAVMGCLRIARHAKDHLNASIFMRELYPDKEEVSRVLYDDTAHLTTEAQQFIWDTSLKRWLQAHSVDFLASAGDEDEGDRRTVLKVAAGEIEPELQQWNASIEDLAVPTGMDPYDAAAFTDRSMSQKAEMRVRIKALQTIKARLKTRCLNYAVQIERQLDRQRQGQGFLEAVQNDVNNYFKARSDDVYVKLQKASQLAASPGLEDAALLLTEVRRALKAAADHFYPPVHGKTSCADGVERSLGEDQYLNRLQEFLAVSLVRSTARELLGAELDHLISFVRRLNDMASKGVHSAATLSESRQGLVGLYFFLFNVSQQLSERQAAVV